MSGISQEFTTFRIFQTKSGKFLTNTRHEIPFDHAQRPLVDLQNRPPLKAGSELVESIVIDHIFIK